jgi:Double-GTPase 2
MAKRVTCPYCWHSFKTDQLLLHCSDMCAAPERTFFTPNRSAKGNCPHGRRPLPRRFCPEPTCSRALLREYLDNEGRNVAVIGSADAGKTTYIGVLLHELKGRVAGRFNGMAVDLLGDESRRNYRERFAEPLFERGEAVRSTARLVGDAKLDPLIFTLKIPTRGRFRSGLQSIISVFYDASGENVLTAQSMDPLARYLESAGGILVLIDPLQMPEISRHYGRALPGDTQGKSVTDQRAVIQRLGELLRESSTKSQKTLKVPLAVAVTKIDVLRETFEDESPLRREPNHNGHYDEGDGADVHEELRAWLDRWYGPEFDNTVAANFTNYRYFGLTALGAAPRDEKRLAKSGVHPYRVEDPMLWLLAQFGSIKREKGRQ